MKMRNGFVSNSSSSSFILFGRRVDLYTLKPKDLKDKNIIIVGKELYNGRDLIELTPRILKEIKKLNKLNKFYYADDIYEVFYSLANSDYDGWDFSKKELMDKLPENFTIYEFKKDNWGTGDDLESFMDKYLHDC